MVCSNHGEVDIRWRVKRRVWREGSEGGREGGWRCIVSGRELEKGGMEEGGGEQ